MRPFFLLLSFVIMVSCSSEPYPDYSELSSKGTYYQILKFDEEGEKVSHGDMVRFYLTSEAESLEALFPSEIQVIQCDTGKSGLKSDLVRFHAGDSLSIIMDDLAFLNEFGISDSLDMDAKSLIMVVREVISESHWFRRKALDQSIKAKRQGEQIKSYLRARGDSADFSWKAGMLWKYDVRGDQGGFGHQEDLLVMYTAKLLDGRMIDERSTPSDALQYKIGMQGQLIPGLQRAISLMGRGDELTLIIPSDLAFGEDGSVGEVVPPWSPIVFNLHVQTMPSED